MAENTSYNKKFDYRLGSSGATPLTDVSHSSDTGSLDRTGVPRLGLRPLPPTTPPPAYPSGSRTQRDTGSAAQRQTGEGGNFIATARIANAVIIDSGSSSTTASSTTASSTTASSTTVTADAEPVRGSSSGKQSSSSVADKAESLQLKLPMKSPLRMPPLPLAFSTRTAEQATSPDIAPPPPSDAPPKPAIKPENTPTPRLPSSSKPTYVEELASPRSAEAGHTIRQIASDIVAAELENGLDLKQIGRLSPKLGGVSVYSRLATHVNRQLAKSEFVGHVDKCKQAVMGKFGKNPDKLTVVEGSATDAGGAHTGVDLDRIAKYLAPVFDFVCGPDQHVADSSLPGSVMSLFKAVDRELLATLLARREQQLIAQKLWSASLPPEGLADKLKELGWTESQFKKLVNEGVFTAEKIHAFRVNMFSGLLFTRCISPFILYNLDELQQESSKRTANPPKPLVKLSEGANKLFKKNHAAFVEDFVRDSNSVLPEGVALALATISSGEDRFSKVKKSKKSPSGSGKTYARSPGRHSAPVMPQGGDFRKLMEEESRAVEAEAAAPRRAPVDYKALRDATIDKFKSRHAADFGDDDFSIAFALALRQWKRANREIEIDAVFPAMKGLHQQVKTDLAGREALERDGPPVQSPARAPNKGSSQRVSASTSPSISTSSAPQPSEDRVTLNEERSRLLKVFEGKPERRAIFERYPSLKESIRQRAIKWAIDDGAGSFGIVLKKIFEDELIKCFYRSYKLTSDAPYLDRTKVRVKAAEWKAEKKAEKEGYDLSLEVLWSIMPKNVQPLTLETVVPNFRTRNAEVATEKFLQRESVARELQENPTLKKRFLHDIRAWIATGAFGEDADNAVQQPYHDALTEQYQRRLEAEGKDVVLVKKLKLAAMQWWADNDAGVLTTAVLRRLLASIENGQ